MAQACKKIRINLFIRSIPLGGSIFLLFFGFVHEFEIITFVVSAILGITGILIIKFTPPYIEFIDAKVVFRFLPSRKKILIRDSELLGMYVGKTIVEEDDGIAFIREVSVDVAAGAIAASEISNIPSVHIVNRHKDGSIKSFIYRVYFASYY